MTAEQKKIPVAIMISGRGSNMQALIRACEQADYPASIALVISHNPEAPGLDYARAAGIKTAIIDHRPFGKDRQAHEKALNDALHQADVQLVCLAGYMRVLTPYFVKSWEGRLLNIHPSLLPAFPGLHTHEAALKAGAQHHGCTVHLVTEGVDEGPVLAQRSIAVLPHDTPETLATRVLEQEHVLYPEALSDFMTSGFIRQN